MAEEDEMIAKHKEEERSKKAQQPLPIAKESGFVETKHKAPPAARPAPHIKEGSTSGAIAAGVVSGIGTFQKLSRNLFYLKIQNVKQLCTSPAASNRGIRSVSLTIV